MHKTPLLLPLLFTLPSLFGGCQGASRNSRTGPTIMVPPSVASDSHYSAAGDVPAKRYVVRMSDGQRDWEIEFPEVASGYEIRIPLKNSAHGSTAALGATAATDIAWDQAALTDADRELLTQLRRSKNAMEREGIFVNGKNVNDAQTGEKTGAVDKTAANETDPAPSRPSYLLGIEKVNQLFKKGSYELAMVRLTALTTAYPEDTRLLSMKGTLWIRMDRPELARAAWEKVLQIDPDNAVVLEALRRLDP